MSSSPPPDPPGDKRPSASAAPEVNYARRQLHLIVIVDCSGSMSGDKIASLNYAMRSMLPFLREVADDNPETDVRLRVMPFSTGAAWKEEEAVPVADFSWGDLSASGETDLGAALRLAAATLTPEGMPGRQLPPVVVLISDGFPSDDFEAGLAALQASPYGKLSVRVAIAIGRDADIEILQTFIGDPNIRPLRANNAQELVNYICWATTAAVKAVSTSSDHPAPLEGLAERAAAEAGDDSEILW